MDFINKPKENDNIIEDIVRDYEKGIDIRSLSKQYLLSQTDIKKVIRNSEIVIKK